jgi:hypothetical protein
MNVTLGFLRGLDRRLRFSSLAGGERGDASAFSAKMKNPTHAPVIQVTAVLPVRDEINVLALNNM